MEQRRDLGAGIGNTDAETTCAHIADVLHRKRVSTHPVVEIDTLTQCTGNPTSRGEFRKSYHGMPPGAAQVLHAPNLFHIQPMQIDTKNRDGSMDRPEQGFSPGPYPKAAVAPRTGPDATYSGLLECPCTDRISKVFMPTWKTQHAGNEALLASYLSMSQKLQFK